MTIYPECIPETCIDNIMVDPEMINQEIQAFLHSTVIPNQDSKEHVMRIYASILHELTLPDSEKEDLIKTPQKNVPMQPYWFIRDATIILRNCILLVAYYNLYDMTLYWMLEHFRTVRKYGQDISEETRAKQFVAYIQKRYGMLSLYEQSHDIGENHWQKVRLNGKYA